MELKIKEAAEAAGVSVRTLHHYDQIGLLQPEKIHENGYRKYSESDMDKLQQIMFFRELDFKLSDIKRILEDPGFDRLGALQAQHELLKKKHERLDSIIATLEKSIISAKEEVIMSNKEKFSAFDMTEIEAHKKKYAEEVREKFGKSDTWLESNKKTSSYKKSDWKRIMENQNEIFTEIAGLMYQDPNSADVQNAVEKWRQHISDNYYNCTIEIFSGLGEMYTTDERFKTNIDKTATGLADFLSKAIKIYCKTID